MCYILYSTIGAIMRSWVYAVALAIFLYACGSENVSEPARVPTAEVNAPPRKEALQKIDAKELFVSKCAACHGKEGKGDGPASSGLNPKPADLTFSTTQKKSDAELEKAIAEGRTGTSMPPWKESLTEKEISELVRYIKKLSAAK